MARKVAMISLFLFLVLSCVLAGWTAVIANRVERQFPPVGQFVALPGGRLHLVDRPPSGKARGTVVLIHGASSNHADLLATLGPDLEASYRVVAIDRPGHGWSDRLGGREMAEPDAQARAIAKALESLDTGPVIVVAHSLGGGVATSLALDRPDLVQGLVLLSGVTHPWPGGISWYYVPASMPVIGPLFTWLFAVPAASAVIDDAARGVFAPSSPPADYLTAGKIPLILRPASFQANAQDVSVLKAFVAGQASRYPALAVPVIAIASDVDTVVSPTIHSAAFVRDVRNGKLVIVEGSGHMPYHKGRARVIAEIERLGREAARQD